MMEINGLSNGALAATVPIVAAASVGVVGLSKENGHSHLHHHHGVDSDALMVSMKLDPSTVHQVHLGQADNGVSVNTVTGVQAQDMVNVNNVVMGQVNANAGNPQQVGVGIAVTSVASQLQQQQMKSPITVPVQVTTASTGTDTGGGGGGLMGNAGQGLLGQGGIIVQTTPKETESTGITTTINQAVTSQPTPVTTTIATGAGLSIVPTSSVNSTSSTTGAGYENKLFVGGLSWQTSSEKLREYFGKFGQVLEVQVVVDPMTQRSRGFGFITFADSDTVRKIVSVPNHILDGKRIDPKHATPRNKQVPAVNTYKTKKIFVGGVSQDTTLDEIKSYFGQFGKVEDAVMLMDQQTMRHRGFGFVTFESDEVVERICEIHYHTIKDKKVECKKAKPKEAQALQVPGVGVSAGLHHAFGHDAAAAAAAAHHLSLATTALGAQRTTPAAYAAFYGGHLGLSNPAAHQPHHHQTASIGNHLAAMPGGLGLIPTTMATMVSAAPGPVTYSTIRSGLARYTPYPVRNWNGNAAAAAAAAAAAVLAPPPPTASAPQIPTGPSPSLLSLSATQSQAQAANNAAFAAYHHAHHASLTSATPTAPSGASTLTAAANTPTIDFAGIAGIPTGAVTGPSIPAATFDWSGVYHV